MADVVNAFVQSPNYRRGALFIVYDEWGGFFDHVRPPSVRDERQSRNLDEDFGQMGFRIPAVAVSPYTRNGASSARVGHDTLGFESILALISHRFGLGHLTTRDRHARNIGRSFDWRRPDFDPPDLPDPQHVASRPCSMGGGDVLEEESAAAHVGDLAALEELAHRHGVPVYDGKASDLFTKPDAMLRAVGKR
jgi:phospholipase C